MKKLLLSFCFIFITFGSFAQKTYEFNMRMDKVYVNGISHEDFKTTLTNHIVIVGDKLIAITNFIGKTKTQYLIVNKKEELPDNLGTRYTCTTKDKDIINGYQKVIVNVNKDEKIIVMDMYAGPDELSKDEFKFRYLFTNY
jgi:hypothetical protein